MAGGGLVGTAVSDGVAGVGLVVAAAACSPCGLDDWAPPKPAGPEGPGRSSGPPAAGAATQLLSSDAPPLTISHNTARRCITCCPF